MEHLILSNKQVVVATFLMLINIFISLLFNLGVAKSLFIAAVRCIVQLLAVGVILQWIFHQQNPYYILVMSLTMTFIAGWTAHSRTGKSFPGMLMNTIMAMFISSWITLLFSIFVIIRPSPWYHPQFFIPLIGMILGNAVTGVSLGMDRFSTELFNKKGQIELILALGGKRFEAAMPSIRESLRMGLIPITNSMMVVGIVSLPGMMTGQIVAGVNPMGAVKYQIMILFVVTTATSLGILMVTLLNFYKLFNSQHQFLVEKIKINKKN